MNHVLAPRAAAKGGQDDAVRLAICYRAGRQAGVVPVERIDRSLREGCDLLWIGLQEPKRELLARVGAELGAGRALIEELARPHRRPKVLDYDGLLLIVAIVVDIEEERPRFGELTLLLGPNFLLTLARGPRCNDAPLREKLEAQPELLARGPDFVAAELLDLLADQFVQLAQAQEAAVERMEQRMVLSPGLEQEDIRHLYHMRRDLLRIHNALSPLAEICRRLSRLEMPMVDAQARPYYGEVADRAQRLVEWFAGLRESLAFAFEAGLMIGQMQQNDITRKLAAWAAILAVPTAIAGLYGMNFEHMPELHWRWGYPAVLGVIGGAIGWLYWRFRRARWL